MEKLHKIISLEQAKNRTPNLLPYYAVDDSKNPVCTLHEGSEDHHPWGGYCIDLLIPVTATKCDSDESCIPEIDWITELWDVFNLQKVEIVDEEEDCTTTGYWARYKNLMTAYFWLVNTFVKSIVFYKKCSSGFKRIHIESTYSICDSDIPLYASLNADNIDNAGDIVGITPMYDELTSRFKSQKNAKSFCQFINRLSTDGLFAQISGTTPYLDVEFSITNSQTDLGLMSPLVKEWEPKKKYYLGEIVLYDNCSYILHTCDPGQYDKFEITGDLLKSVLNDTTNSYRIVDTIPNDIYNITFKTNVEPGVYVNKYNYTYQRCVLREIGRGGLLKFSFIYPYYNGNFDRITRAYSFDSKGNEHWMRMDSTLETDVPYTQEFTGITESKLIALKRRIPSVDDIGRKLDFVINEDDDVAEMLYMLGITNEVVSDEIFETPDDNGLPISDISINRILKYGHGDDMVSIRYKGNNQNDTWQDITHDGGIIPDDFDVDSGIIEFTYYIGCDIKYLYIPPQGGVGDVTVVKNRIPFTGVKYVEEWNFRKTTTTFDYNNENVTYEYIYISPNQTNNNYGKGNLDIQNKEPIYSIVTYYGKQAKINEAIITPIYKDEDILGIQDINTLEYDITNKKYVSSIDAYIARGTAASFERHNILGEVKTFADLENYRNNFFQL